MALCRFSVSCALLSCGTAVLIGDALRQQEQSEIRTMSSRLEGDNESSSQELGGGWFLSESELTAVRAGHPREYINQASADNTIQYWEDGKDFMSRLRQVLDETDDGDLVYCTTWDIDPEIYLEPNHLDMVASNRSKLINVLAAAGARGVRVHILFSGHKISDVVGIDRICENLNIAVGGSKDAQVCIADYRHGYRNMGSFHAKTWMISRGGRLTAFSGSMDIGDGRWDTQAHDTSLPEFKMQPHDPKREFAWHGGMYETEGTAALDVLRTFEARWNDPFSTDAKVDGKLMLTPVEPFEPTVPSNGRIPMQVVVSFGCKRDIAKTFWGKDIANDLGAKTFWEGFAPKGEYSYAGSYFKALHRAKDYIFLADQIMWFDEALHAVAEAAKHVKFIIVLTNEQLLTVDLPGWAEWLAGGKELDIDILKKAVQRKQHEGLYGKLEQLEKEGNMEKGELSKKVHMFNLGKKGRHDRMFFNQIYDHEKTLIVDDEFALVGSCGMERTSFTNDHDLSFAIHDQEYVSNLRRRMFAHLLLIDTSDPNLATPDKAFAEWMRQADDGDQRVRHYMPEASDGWRDTHTRMVSKAFHHVMEPDGRCYEAEGDSKDPQWDAALGA